MMRRIRYSVAMSLDGYIAGPNGESDWILMDPEIDFGALMNSFDTILMGRRTFEAAQSGGGGGSMQGMKAIVVSRTLRQEDYPDITIIGEDLEAFSNFNDGTDTHRVFAVYTTKNYFTGLGVPMLYGAAYYPPIRRTLRFYVTSSGESTSMAICPLSAAV